MLKSRPTNASHKCVALAFIVSRYKHLKCFTFEKYVKVTECNYAIRLQISESTNVPDTFFRYLLPFQRYEKIICCLQNVATDIGSDGDAIFKPNQGLY